MATKPHFKLSARPTRGGYRGVASLGNGIVALKTVPVFRKESEALDAIRAWVSRHGAHADRRRKPGRRHTSCVSHADARATLFYHGYGYELTYRASTKKHGYRIHGGPSQDMVFYSRAEANKIARARIDDLLS
jgi:hypothetical protein